MALHKFPIFFHKHSVVHWAVYTCTLGTVHVSAGHRTRVHWAVDNDNCLVDNGMSTMECLGCGSLVLTDKNMIFFSNLKSVKIPYKKLIGVTPYADGIGVQRDGANAKRQVFEGFDSWFVMNLLSYIHI